MANKKVSELNETINTGNDDYVMIVQGGVNKKVKVQYLKGASNLTNEFLELQSLNGQKYRTKVNNDGELVVYPIEVDTATAPQNNQNQTYWGLIINQIYGAGISIVDTPVSHSFIELYNTKSIPINLKGLYLWYKTLNGTWQNLELKGIIPPYHSFLIRCKQQNDIHKDFVRCKVTNYDMEWDIALTSEGFSVYLCIGGEALPEDNPVKYIYDVYGAITETRPRYIDLIAAGGKGVGQNVTAFEKYYWNCMDCNTSLHRIDFKYGTNNQVDCEPIDYKTCNVSVYRPRSLSDGEWDIFYNKPRLNPKVPNLVNIAFGENGDTTRTFTWQTVITEENYLKYRKQGSSVWTTIPTTKEIVKHKENEVMVHRVIINGLTSGAYEYQCGEEGAWSDIYTFTVRNYTSSDRIKYLWTTDTQGWDQKEYDAWGTTIKNVMNWETYDFHIDTGDISQNGINNYEWLMYFKHTGTSLKQKEHMFCVG